MKKVLAVALLGALALIGSESTGRFLSSADQLSQDIHSKMTKDEPIDVRYILNKSVPDDSFVRVQGVVLKQLGDDDYLFADNTGKIKLELEPQYFGGVDITHKDIINVRVKVDIDKKKVEIEAVEPIQVVGKLGALDAMNLDNTLQGLERGNNP